MFRDLYKSANEEIKGDRALLDKAFERAAAPEKKKPLILQYSFVGTAAAAVIIAGAVFANSNLFTDKVTNIPPENVINQKEVVSLDEEATVLVSDEDVNVNIPVAVNEEPAPNSENGVYTETSDEEINYNEEVLSVNEDEAEIINEDNENEETAGGAIMVTALYEDEGENVAVYQPDEASTEEVVTSWSLRPHIAQIEETDGVAIEYEAEEEYAEEWEETVVETEAVIAPTESEEAEDDITFFLMESFNIEGDYEKITESFSNTEEKPIATAEEALERAKNEIETEYEKAAIYYISSEDLWVVVFTYGEQCRCVYLDSMGVTQLIIDGKMVVFGA